MLSTFWCQQMEKYPVIAKKSLDLFVPFVTTYLCEQSFSRMLDIETKKRNRLCCENDMRLALSKVKPRISELVSQRQQQKTHWGKLFRVHALCWFCYSNKVILMHNSFRAPVKKKSYFIFYKRRIRWMSIWNWWGSVPPTRLRTTGLDDEISSERLSEDGRSDLRGW